MGINGLLRSFQRLKSIQSKGKKSHNILEFRGKKLAIDASCILFKAAYCCAERLVESIDRMGPDKHADAVAEKAYTGYVLRQCDMLLTHAGIEEIVLVFDSPNRLPLKKDESNTRDKKRRENLKEARRLKSLGRKNEASMKYKAAIKVTNRMAQVTAGAIKKRYDKRSGSKVRCIFAPYEADAQLAKLCSDGEVDVCMTEDSDVLVYLAASNCISPVIYKFEKSSGQCDVFCLDWLINDEKGNKNITSLALLLAGETDSFASALRFMARREQRENGSGRRMFIQACVLSGCDYVPHLGGVGPIKAFKLVQENASRQPDVRFGHILRSLCGSRVVSKSVSSKATASDDGMTTFMQYHEAPLDPNQMNENELAEYEVLLAKSEAAFYYHHVSSGEKMTPLQPLYYADSVNVDIICRHQPCMSRFKDNVSFIGSAIGTTKGNMDLKVSSSIFFLSAHDTIKAGISEELHLDSNAACVQDHEKCSAQQAQHRGETTTIVCATNKSLPPCINSDSTHANQMNPFSCYSYSVCSSEDDYTLEGAHNPLKPKVRRVSTESERDFKTAERLNTPKENILHSDGPKYSTSKMKRDIPNGSKTVHNLGKEFDTPISDAINQPKNDPWSDDDTDCMIIESPKSRPYPADRKKCNIRSCRTVLSVDDAKKKLNRFNKSGNSLSRHLNNTTGSKILAGFAKQQALYRQIHPVDRDSASATKGKSSTLKKRKNPGGTGVTLRNYFKKSMKSKAQSMSSTR